MNPSGSVRNVPSFADMPRLYRAKSQLTAKRNIRAEWVANYAAHTKYLSASAIEELSDIATGAAPEPGQFPRSMPRMLPPIFGRDRERNAIMTLLSPQNSAAARLVTLTGPGGIGKTRLALDIAAQLKEQFEGRVGFVSLAGSTDPDALAPIIASALRLSPCPGVAPEEQIRDALQRTTALLVLDNMENIAANGGTRFISDLLFDLPHLTCLVTSRVPLELDEETEYPVMPLPVSSLSQEKKEANGAKSFSASPIADLMSCPSIHMFAERARRIRPDFTLTPYNATVIAGIMNYIEGVPLALELAATWVHVMTPAQMLERLRDRLSRESDVAETNLSIPHRSLHAVLEISVGLLPVAVRRHFATLSVFRGSWDLPAAEAVCSSMDAATSTGSHFHDKIDEVSVAEAIRILRHHSLLRQEESTVSDSEPRFRLSETVREFAFSTLTATQKSAAIRAHARFFAARAEQSRETDRWCAESPFDRATNNTLDSICLKADSENLSSAICGALSLKDEKGTAVRVAVAIGPLWYSWGMAPVGIRILEKVLSAVKDEPGIPALLLAELYFGLGRLYHASQSAENAVLAFSSCLNHCDELQTNPDKDSKNEQRLGRLASAAALCRILALNDSGATATTGLRDAYAEHLRRIQSQKGPITAMPWEIAWATTELARMEIAANNPGRALELLRTSKPLCIADGDQESSIVVSLLEADALDALQQQEQADLIRATVAELESRPGATQSNIAASLLLLGYITVLQGDITAGRSFLAEAAYTYAVAENDRGIALARQLRNRLIPC